MSVIPGRPGSALIAELPDPSPGQGPVLVRGLLAGICGTDAEILRGGGQPPDGEPRLVIGHESLGRVLEAPADAPVRPGDLVAGVVRRPDPVPCPACADGQWDFCANGRYTERGIKGLAGYGATLWRVSPRFAVRIMLAALFGRQRGYQVHVFDRVADGPKPALAAALGATYHHGPAGTVEALDLCPDVVLECTGAGELVVELAAKLAPAGVLCLIGVSSVQHRLAVDMNQVGRSMVLGNSVIFGTVSAARRHYEQAVEALARADPAWLGGLISRRVPLSSWPDGLAREPGDVKVVVDLTQ